jgi:preprotein translocase subunit SecE
MENQVVNIKYIFIGDIAQKGFIGDHPSKGNEQSNKDARQIFERLCKGNNKKYDERNKLVGNGGNYFFTVTPQNIFYLILAESNFEERFVFEMVANLQNDNVPSLRGEKGTLSNEGLSKLESIVAKYQKISAMKSAMSDINDVKGVMKDNIKKAMTNIEDTKELDDKALRIKEGALMFQDNAQELKRVTWCQNFKYTIIIVVVVIAILLIIIIPLCLK